MEAIPIWNVHYSEVFIDVWIQYVLFLIIIRFPGTECGGLLGEAEVSL